MNSTVESAFRARWVAAAAALSLFLGGCRGRAPMPHTPFSGGDTTTFDATRDAFGQPAPRLSEEHRRQFFVGNSFFNQNWLEAPATVETRDGLGPLFNARSCSACHFKDGRSRPPEAGKPLSTVLLRISVPGVGAHNAPNPDPVYGDQIQGNAITGAVKEAEVFVEYEPLPGAFPDGERYVLQKPRYRLEHLGYGSASSRLLVSARAAPALVGLGLLEAVPVATLTALSDPTDRNQDGISGRVNRVWDVARQRSAPGRFGWKAEQPSVLQQSAAAFLGDLGLTTSIFPKEPLTAGQAALSHLPNGGSPEVNAEVLLAISIYARVLAVPARRNYQEPSVARGEDAFQRLGCAACHLPTLKTGVLTELPELGAQEIHPYSDLLLHDLGDDLSDQRPAFDALGSEWRTPPLWGIGLVSRVNEHTRFLHDGRARSLQEAILWHGGEAAAARDRFMAAPVPERRELLRFLESL